MIDIKRGEIKTKGGLIIYPNYTFNDFKSSRFYNGQDGVRVIYLDEKQMIDNQEFIVSLFFRNSKIYMLSLICCDFEFTASDESKRKLIHNEILKKIGIDSKEKFTWGKISSDFDARSNISSINILYF